MNVTKRHVTGKAGRISYNKPLSLFVLDSVCFFVTQNPKEEKP